jgi:hypothetical protein
VCTYFFVIQREVLSISIYKDNILFNLDFHQNIILLLYVLYFHKQANKRSQHTQSPHFFYSCQQNYKTTDVKGDVIEGINGGRPHRRPVTSLEVKCECI